MARVLVSARSPNDFVIGFGAGALRIFRGLNPRVFTLVCLGLAFGFAATKALPPGSRAPSVELGEFGAAHLDKILAPLDRQVPLPRNDVAQLRESFLDRASRATAEEKLAYQAAIAVCKALSEAMDEREKAISSFESSSAVHGSFDLGAHRKDRPTKREFRRERHEEENRKEEAAQKDRFLNTQLTASWLQRTIQIRQNIDRLYSRERELERKAQQQAPGARESVTLDKPIQVKVKYGTAIIPAGTILSVVSRDANGVVVEYLGEKVTLPP